MLAGWFFMGMVVVPGRSTTVKSGTSGEWICRAGGCLGWVQARSVELAVASR